MENKRLPWIDALNITACMGVLLLHCTNSPIHSFDGNINTNWFIGLLTHSFFLWPVNIFFMLSGYTLINGNITHQGGVNNFYIKRLSRLLCPLIVWNTFYACLTIFRSEHPGSFTHIIEKYFFFEYNGFLWFFVPLILIYISLPFFSVFCIKADRLLLRLFLIIGLTMSIIPPVDADFSVRHTTYDIYPMGSRFLYFIAAGYYLGNYKISKTTRKILYLASIVSAIIIFVGTMFIMTNHNEHYKYFISYTNFPCTIMALGVFTFFKYSNMTCSYISSNVLEKLSSLSLGIYLIQAFWFMVLAKLHICENMPLLKFLIMYVVCIVSVWIIKQIPVIKKIV